MLLTQSTPGTTNPVPLREFAEHLRLAHGFEDDTAQDALLEVYLRSATTVIERRLSCALIRRTYELRVAHWDRYGYLTLPVGPVSEIASIRFERPGMVTSLAPEEWYVKPGETRQKLTGPKNTALRDIPHGALAVLTFEAGYGETWNDVPDDLRQAVMVMAAHNYEHRGNDATITTTIPPAVRAILTPRQPTRL
ncbi:MAG: head-tail connector protein [Pseudomonadota bacterium]